ncbi:hypothetical protein E1269_21365 [Jiangella asiatica]|uniref:Scaffolding protein n=2 Tax=Jiangella asiatica TaxID=2530372 RepID=A0A4R5CYA9_9ACTN|nr:hypothetical protein E1269_21365 [Jiangella asiatica]
MSTEIVGEHGPEVVPAEPAAPAAPATPPGDPAKSPEQPSAKPEIIAERDREREKRQQLESMLAQSLGVELNTGGKESHFEQISARLTKLKEFEDAQLTEQQRLEKERDEARETAATTARQAALYKAAIDHSLGAEDLELLEGVPADQIDARAKRLSERLAASRAPGTPKPDPTQGPRGGGIDIDAQIAEAQKAGDFRKVISLQNQKLTNQVTNQ